MKSSQVRGTNQGNQGAIHGVVWGVQIRGCISISTLEFNIVSVAAKGCL